MTVVAIALYYQLGGPQSRIDPLRVIEGMAAAIGIIAAGLIIVRGGEGRNLTTAAHIWLTAGIGIASGAGYFAVVLIAAGLRSEGHTSELHSLMRLAYCVLC